MARNPKSDIFAVAVERALPWRWRNQAYDALPAGLEAEFVIEVAVAGRVSRGKPSRSAPTTPLFSAQVVAELAAALRVRPERVADALVEIWARRTNSRRELDPKDVAEGCEEGTALLRAARDKALSGLKGSLRAAPVLVDATHDAKVSEVTIHGPAELAALT